MATHGLSYEVVKLLAECKDHPGVESVISGDEVQRDLHVASVANDTGECGKEISARCAWSYAISIAALRLAEAVHDDEYLVGARLGAYRDLRDLVTGRKSVTS